MLKAKQMPKKKQTKQTKKPAKNDGKITKKKYIKTKIIGGQMIQMLKLKDKLEYLKDCLINATTATVTFEDVFKHYKITDSVSDISDLKEYSYVYDNETIGYFDNCLKRILLCLYNHDEYNSYALLDKAFQVFNNKRNEKIPAKFKTVAITEEKEQELSTKSDLYFEKYKNFLDYFIKKIISVADPPPVIVVEALDGEPRGTREETVPEGQGAPEVAPDEKASEVTGQGGVAPEVTEQPSKSEGVFNGGLGNPFSLLSTSKTAITQYEREQDIFKTGMFQIYDEGIVLLNIDDIYHTDHTLQVFKSVDKVEKTINEKDEIITFFNTNNEVLIIRRYKSDITSTDYYELECRIQLMYKLVKILLDNINLYDEALKEQLETNLKKPEFLLNYKTNLLAKLIAIIFEKLPLKVTDIKYGIILKSLKVIILNNKGIDDTYIEKEYTKYLKNRNIEATNIESIIALSNYKPTYTFATCENRKEYFEHIINVLYTNKEAESDETEKYKDGEVNEELEILIKLSASASPGVSLLGKTFEENCNTTINKIKKEKGYLISEASIQSLELKDKYYTLERSTINSEKEIEIESALKKYYELINKYINKEIKGLYYDIKYEPTTRAILKIYDEFRTTFNTKINYLPNVNALKPITATRVIQ